MRFRLLIHVILISSISLKAVAQKAYPGRWVEVQRSTRQGQPLTFSDTMKLSQVTSDSLLMMKGSFAYKGTIINDLLDMGYQQLQIIKLSDDEIRIGDEDYIHILKPAIATNASGQINQERSAIAFPAEPVKTIDKALLKGIWEPYKKDRKKGISGKIDYKTLVKKLDFDAKANPSTYGNIMVGNAIYSITSIDEGKLKAAVQGAKERRFLVWQLNPDEIIIEDENGMIYFMKQF